ncbi:hypothetical protein B0H17DRAFT_558555 [Mycena rosella]|uniref:Uncharacterized protein n=1 Tax=Mycena rosella TaxID=1033263 RepID=A0AAD7GJ67_MYCRO|nr:hypothetical protein B0H17DRAFT_558555 [Mycena rosella]
MNPQPIFAIVLSERTRPAQLALRPAPDRADVKRSIRSGERLRPLRPFCAPRRTCTLGMWRAGVISISPLSSQWRDARSGVLIGSCLTSGEHSIRRRSRPLRPFCDRPPANIMRTLSACVTSDFPRLLLFRQYSDPNLNLDVLQCANIAPREPCGASLRLVPCSVLCCSGLRSMGSAGRGPLALAPQISCRAFWIHGLNNGHTQCGCARTPRRGRTQRFVPAGVPCECAREHTRYHAVGSPASKWRLSERVHDPGYCQRFPDRENP